MKGGVASITSGQVVVGEDIGIAGLHGRVVGDRQGPVALLDPGLEGHALGPEAGPAAAVSVSVSVGMPSAAETVSSLMSPAAPPPSK